MTRKEDLEDWIIESLKKFDRKASIVQICRYIWEKYEQELRKSGDLFYTWQYDVRWAATRLRGRKILRVAESSTKGIWELL